MEKQTHTPGPWIIQPVKTGDTHAFIRAALPGYSTPRKIAELTDVGAAAEANARLIAAAPDLLAALKLLANADIKAVFTEKQARAALDDMVSLARDAVAKATDSATA